ncbi:hypothetical protein BASA50_009994 [Batrachochytrium salamandrivorans]|uniref:non-specific serine/threonine protein kinase n=1 Tax=Batrachochytrium salamandrivorans TaxID=1357716 RepID=A0ABQ8F2J1_9FUNG|nr:hypothetical protein BASA50_009994 [Batrachochytrium salamandrivorans]KAH9273602.1 hypothetical protein BASA83_003932 [Batrachochytrium salamandrivorans]
MSDPLLWVLHHFITHYAGQTTQGNTNEGDGFNHASGSKQDTGLLQIANPTTLPTTLQESNTLDQSDASSYADFQPEEECGGGHGIRKISKSCPQQPSPPGSQPSTLHVLPQSDEMPLPAYLGKSEGKSYRRDQKTDEYDAFIASETQYFKSEYLFEKELGKGSSGVVYLATRKSDGMQVAYKSIPKSEVDDYASEPSPPPICHLPNHLVLSEEASVAQCMSSRPPNLLLPYELLLQMYLSRPGHENPYVPTTFDYITLKNKFVLVMEYIGGSWVTLSKYVEGKERPDIVEARNIIREIVNGMIYLKQYGILHRDIHGMLQ